MSLLGKVHIHRPHSVSEAREKIRQVILALTDDSLIATRLATAVSQLCRQMELQGKSPLMSVQLLQKGHSPRLQLVFQDEIPLPRVQFLDAFFDNVTNNATDDGLFKIKVFKALEDISGINIDSLKSIMATKSRNQLLEELQNKNREMEEKNRELQESLENLRQTTENLQRTTFAKERMESELNIGQEIQMSMLPLIFPPFPNRHELDIFAALIPAREVGGDFYDFFFIDDDRLCFCVGDVSGKGVPAALFMAVTKTLIKSRAKDDFSTASLMTHVNDELSLDNTASMFVTIFVGILNVKSGDFVFTNAGHNPPYIKRHSGELERLDSLHGPVIGAMEEMIYGEKEARLLSGDLLYLYTDGVTEAMNVNDELFSEDRLCSYLNKSDIADVEVTVNSTVAMIEKFQGEADQADDITVMALKFYGLDIKKTTVKIKNDLAEIEQVNAQFDLFSSESGIEESIVRKLYMVFDELLNNIISYAYIDEQQHFITIEMEISDERLAITIVDDGIPFNPFIMKTPDTNLSLEERDIGGLGIHLVRTVMDEFSYQRRTDQNVITLVKMLKNRTESNE